MGLRVQEIPPHWLPLMSQPDQAALGHLISPPIIQGNLGQQIAQASSAPDPKLNPHPEPKSGLSEKSQQDEFSKWLLELQETYDIPFVWHAMHKPSRASPGTPDFWVGVGHGIWIEFKADYGCELSGHQELFRRRCEKRNIEMYVVYSASSAKKLVQERLDLATLI